MKLLRYGHLMDPASGLDDERDLVIDDQGRVAEIAPVGSLFYEDMDFDEIIDLEGKLVAPGFIDVHVHFRDPGLTYKEASDRSNLSNPALIVNDKIPLIVQSAGRIHQMSISK